jgi:hypothetical protein
MSPSRPGFIRSPKSPRVTVKHACFTAHDAIDRIRRTGHVSSWSVEDWYDFAIGHLGLRPVSPEEAIDSRTLEAANALEQYRQRSRSLIGTNLPPLLAASDDEIYGAGLVQRLLDAQNALLVGPSGSAKTFHTHHAVMAMLAGDVDVPIIVEAKRYRSGDIWTLIRQCLAPVFPGDARPLIAAAALTNTRPVLFIDGLNDCSIEHREELLKGAVAFALQYDARTIITAQTPLPISGLTVDLLTLELPSDRQKREIYAFHARVPSSNDLDNLCGRSQCVRADDRGVLPYDGRAAGYRPSRKRF